jgi:dolichol-phosphate mannosyltransferase
MALVSIVFSYRNEAKVLPLLLERLHKVIESEPEDFELVFVDDASTDNSVEVISSFADRIPGLAVVRMSRKWGIEECFLAGLEQAKGDAVIFMYTDLQDPPEVIHEMLAKWRAGAEVVHTVRRKRIGEKPSKVIMAWLVYRVIARLASHHIPPDAGEFKLMSRRVADYLKALPETEPYLRGLIPWIGFNQAYVEYDLQPRAAGVSQVALFGRKAWQVTIAGLVSFSERPVHLAVIGGGGATALSLPWLLGTLLWGSATAMLFPFLLLLWGTLMLAVGFVGLYATRAYKDVRGRPRWIVKDVLHPALEQAQKEAETANSV